MKIEYEKIEQYLNAYGKLVLEKIKQDYGHALSEKQKEYLTQLSNDSKFIKVNKPTAEDIAFFSKQKGIEKEENFSQEYVPSAHGGRTKQDDKIHIYPYSKAFEKCKSNDEILNVCVKDLVVHEIFHYFIRPEAKEEKEFGHFLTEGLVQEYAEKLSQKYNLQMPKSNYNENVLAAQKIYAGFPSEWSEEKKERLVFQGSVEELITRSKEGKNVIQQFKENKKFKDDISLLVQESTFSLGMNEKQTNEIVSFYKRMSNRSEVVSNLYNNLNEYFKANEQQKNYFVNRLKTIAPNEYQKMTFANNNSKNQINEQRVDLMLQKQQLQAQKQENLQQSMNTQKVVGPTRTLTNNGYISAIISIAITIASGIIIAFLLRG